MVCSYFVFIYDVTKFSRFYAAIGVIDKSVYFQILILDARVRFFTHDTDYSYCCYKTLFNIQKIIVSLLPHRMGVYIFSAFTKQHIFYVTVFYCESFTHAGNI